MRFGHYISVTVRKTIAVHKTLILMMMMMTMMMMMMITMMIMMMMMMMINVFVHTRPLLCKNLNGSIKTTLQKTYMSAYYIYIDTLETLGLKADNKHIHASL